MQKKGDLNTQALRDAQHLWPQQLIPFPSWTWTPEPPLHRVCRPPRCPVTSLLGAPILCFPASQLLAQNITNLGNVSQLSDFKTKNIVGVWRRKNSHSLSTQVGGLGDSVG